MLAKVGQTYGQCRPKTHFIFHFAFFEGLTQKVSEEFRCVVHGSEKNYKQKQNMRFNQSLHEGCIGTNGEPVAADIFYHRLPFHDLTCIAINRV